MDFENKNIDEIVSMLDDFARSDEGRMKVKMSETLSEGEKKREYHLGRCDINSPWACGTAFDVLEDNDDTKE